MPRATGADGRWEGDLRARGSSEVTSMALDEVVASRETGAGAGSSLWRLVKAGELAAGVGATELLTWASYVKGMTDTPEGFDWRA